MIFPDYKTFLHFSMGHGHDYHWSTCWFAETSKSCMFSGIAPAQSNSGVFTFFLIDNPMMNPETSFWERFSVACEKFNKLITAINNFPFRSMNLAGPVV